MPRTVLALAFLALCSPAPAQDRDREVLARLREIEITYAAESVPLEEALAEVSRVGGVDFVIDRRIYQLRDPEALRLSIRVAGITLVEHIDLVLSILRLQWRIHAGAVYVEPREESGRDLVKYDVSAFAPHLAATFPDRPGSSDRDLEAARALRELVAEDLGAAPGLRLSTRSVVLPTKGCGMAWPLSRLEAMFAPCEVEVESAERRLTVPLRAGEVVARDGLALQVLPGSTAGSARLRILADKAAGWSPSIGADLSIPIDRMVELAVAGDSRLRARVSPLGPPPFSERPVAGRVLEATVDRILLVGEPGERIQNLVASHGLRCDVSWDIEEYFSGVEVDFFAENRPLARCLDEMLGEHRLAWRIDDRGVEFCRPSDVGRHVLLDLRHLSPPLDFRSSGRPAPSAPDPVPGLLGPGDLATAGFARVSDAGSALVALEGRLRRAEADLPGAVRVEIREGELSTVILAGEGAWIAFGTGPGDARAVRVSRADAATRLVEYESAVGVEAVRLRGNEWTAVPSGPSVRFAGEIPR